MSGGAGGAQAKNLTNYEGVKWFSFFLFYSSDKCVLAAMFTSFRVKSFQSNILMQTVLFCFFLMLIGMWYFYEKRRIRKKILKDI